MITVHATTNYFDPLAERRRVQPDDPAQAEHKKWVIVASPDPDFRPGAWFDVTDFIASINVWPVGTVFRFMGDQYTVSGGNLLTRQDGVIMIVASGRIAAGEQRQGG